MEPPITESTIKEFTLFSLSKITTGGENEYWVLKKYIFDTLVALELLYDVEVWGGSIPEFTCKDFENFQKHFLMKFLEVKLQKGIHAPT